MSFRAGEGVADTGGRGGGGDDQSSIEVVHATASPGVAATGPVGEAFGVVALSENGNDSFSLLPSGLDSAVVFLEMLLWLPVWLPSWLPVWLPLCVALPLLSRKSYPVSSLSLQYICVLIWPAGHTQSRCAGHSVVVDVRMSRISLTCWLSSPTRRCFGDCPRNCLGDCLSLSKKVMMTLKSAPQRSQQVESIISKLRYDALWSRVVQSWGEIEIGASPDIKGIDPQCTMWQQMFADQDAL